MIALSEFVGLPTLIVLVLLAAWVGSDAWQASDIDAALDSNSAAERAARAAHNDSALDVLLHQPWWEIDAGPLTDRARRRGWSQSSNQPHQRDGDPTARLPG